MATSDIDIDVNCSTCFNNIVEALRQTPGVNAVDRHASGGCLEVGGNGEYVMGLVHANTEHRCGIHS